jgi:hypothetical protein
MGELGEEGEVQAHAIRLLGIFSIPRLIPKLLFCLLTHSRQNTHHAFGLRLGNERLAPHDQRLLRKSL